MTRKRYYANGLILLSIFLFLPRLGHAKDFLLYFQSPYGPQEPEKVLKISTVAPHIVGSVSEIAKRKNRAEQRYMVSVCEGLESEAGQGNCETLNSEPFTFDRLKEMWNRFDRRLSHDEKLWKETGETVDTQTQYVPCEMDEREKRWVGRTHGSSGIGTYKELFRAFSKVNQGNARIPVVEAIGMMACVLDEEFKKN